MSELEIRRAIRPIRAAGQEVEFMVEMIESGRYTIKDCQRIRKALVASWVKNTGEHSAWIRTPAADSTSLVTHAWIEQGERSVFRSACHLIILATAHQLVAAHAGMDEFGGFRACGDGKRGFRKQQGVPIKFGELYERTGKGVPA